MINIIYIYPNTEFINKEINICRIIDNELKETLVIFGVKENNNVNIYITNTMTGDNKLIKEIKDIGKFNKLIELNETNIKSMKGLFEVEKYILNKIGQ